MAGLLAFGAKSRGGVNIGRDNLGDWRGRCGNAHFRFDCGSRGDFLSDCFLGRQFVNRRIRKSVFRRIVNRLVVLILHRFLGGGRFLAKGRRSGFNRRCGGRAPILSKRFAGQHDRRGALHGLCCGGVGRYLAYAFDVSSGFFTWLDFFGFFDGGIRPRNSWRAFGGVFGFREPSASATPAAASPAIALFLSRRSAGFRARRNGSCYCSRHRRCSAGAFGARWSDCGNIRRGDRLQLRAARTITAPSIASKTVISRTFGADRALVAGYFIEIFVLFEEIRHVQKRVALQAQIHEGGLHARQYAGHAPFVDAPCQRVLIGALRSRPPLTGRLQSPPPWSRAGWTRSPIPCSFVHPFSAALYARAADGTKRRTYLMRKAVRRKAIRESRSCR